jgi:flagellum-specific ATP synthase
MTADLDGTLHLLAGLQPAQAYGKVTKVVGLVAEARGIKAPLGSVCQLLPEDTGRQVINAEVVGFRDDVMLLMPYGEMRGIRPGSLIRNTSTPPVFPVGNRYLGHAIDAFGQSLDPEKSDFSCTLQPLAHRSPQPSDPTSHHRPS